MSGAGRATFELTLAGGETTSPPSVSMPPSSNDLVLTAPHDAPWRDAAGRR